MQNIKYLSNAEFLPHVIALANEGKEVIIPLRGYSMRPFLEDRRDKAVLVKIQRDLRVGDVVLAELNPGHYVLHRIIAIHGDKVQMLGDGNLDPDPVIDVLQVRVIAKSFIRKGSDKRDNIDDTYFRMYSLIWMRLRPVRRWLLAVWRRLPSALRDKLI